MEKLEINKTNLVVSLNKVLSYLTNEQLEDYRAWIKEQKNECLENETDEEI